MVDTAIAIAVNGDIYASTGLEGDIDCYRMSLAEDAVIQPRLAFTPTDSKAKAYVLTIMGSCNQKCSRVDIRGQGSTKAISPLRFRPVCTL